MREVNNFEKSAQIRRKGDESEDGGSGARRHVFDLTKNLHRVCLLGGGFVRVVVCAGSGYTVLPLRWTKEGRHKAKACEAN